MPNYEAKYNKYKHKYLELQKNKLMTGGGNKNTLHLFKAEWCGHCQHFKPIWDALQNDKTMQQKVSFVEHDGDKDKSSFKKYEVSGFPTIILETKNKTIEYVGNRDADGLIDFINNYN